MKKAKAEWKGGSRQFLGAYTVSVNNKEICFTWSEEQAKMVSEALDMLLKANKAYAAEYDENYYKTEKRKK